MRIPVITVQRAIADNISSEKLFACAFANADQGATAYAEGHASSAARLWAQSDDLLKVAQQIRIRELARAA